MEGLPEPPGRLAGARLILPWAYGGGRWHNLGIGGSGTRAFRFDPTVPDPDNTPGVASHRRIVGNEKDGDAFFLIEPLEYP